MGFEAPQEFRLIVIENPPQEKVRPDFGPN